MNDPTTLNVLNTVALQLSREGKPSSLAVKLVSSPRQSDQQEVRRLLEAARKS